MSAPVEVTTRYVTSVADLPSAWAFVMEHIDKLGPEPSVHIAPKHIFGWDEIGDERAESRLLFEVDVHGMIRADEAEAS